MSKKNVYAVKNGRVNGLFFSWQECEKQVSGFKGAIYKGFATVDEAEAYLRETIQEKKNNFIKNSSSVLTKDSEYSTDMLRVYVDGSYNSKRKIAGYGLVLVQNDKVILKDFSAYPYIDVTQSHNVGIELIGAKRAVELALANQFKELTILYDYLGIEKFATNEWKAKTEQTQEYQQFMLRYMKHIKITFIKIKSHSGNKFNDMADKLAKFATHL